MIARRWRDRPGTENPVPCRYGIEVEARRRVQEARPVAQGETSGEAPEAGREQAEPQGLGSEIARRAGNRVRAPLRSARRPARHGGCDGRRPSRAGVLRARRRAHRLRRRPQAEDHHRARAARRHRAHGPGPRCSSDHYDDADWSALWWVRVRGPAAVHDPADPVVTTARAALSEKYLQYRQSPPMGPTYSILIESLTWWSAK